MASTFTHLSSQNILITFITTIFILSSSLSAASTGTNVRHPPPFKRIYAFGDSYTDTGNTKSVNGPSGFGHVSNLPYGMTFFHHSTNRYCDGRLVIDFIAEALSLPYLPPYLSHTANTSHGVNFAVAGATAISHDFFVKNNLTLDITPQSLQTQLIWFNKFLEGQGCGGAMSQRRCKALFDDALVWVGEIGVNDFAYSFPSTIPSSTIQALAIRSVTGFLQAILKKGAKYVVVEGQPPTGCLPLSLSLAPDNDRDDLGCVGSVNKHNYDYNTVLQAKLHEFRVQFPHAVIAYEDYWSAYRTVIQNLDKYGFKDPFMTCCGTGGKPYNYELFNVCGVAGVNACPNPSQYINWDGVHLTEAMYKVVSGMFLHGSFSHPPFDYLLRRKRHLG